MFGFLKSSKEPEVPAEKRRYFENHFLWLIMKFGESLPAKKPLGISKTDFPVKYDGTIGPVQQTLEIICRQMDIDPGEIFLYFMDEPPATLNTGTGVLPLNIGGPLGIFWGKNKDGKFEIGILKSLATKPVELVAVLTHELAHVQLLGGRMLYAKYDRDHELLTDMFCVFCGMGVFRANSAFNFRNGFDGWSYRYSGYLNEPSWLYLLCLYAFWRGEEKPEWASYLKPSLEKEFYLYMAWMKNESDMNGFILSEWKNMETERQTEIYNLSGTWIKQSTYGEGYKNEGIAGKKMLSTLHFTDTDGVITGTGTDDDASGLPGVPISIEGTVRGTVLHFGLTYQFADKVDENGIVLRKADKQPHTVLYSGMYSPFLNACIGEWKIIQKSPEGKDMLTGYGTFEMKPVNT